MFQSNFRILFEAESKCHVMALLLKTELSVVILIHACVCKCNEYKTQLLSMKSQPFDLTFDPNCLLRPPSFFLHSYIISLSLFLYSNILSLFLYSYILSLSLSLFLHSLYSSFHYFCVLNSLAFYVSFILS